jgi:pilus assembly protein CpaB
MKTARLIVLGVAVAAGGLAAFIVSQMGEAPPTAPVAAPAAQLETVDVLVARSDIGIGQSVSAQDLQWQPWPAVSAASAFIRKNDRPGAIEEVAGAIARAPLANGEPIRENRLIKANGSGYMAAILRSGMRAISTEVSPETGAGGFILPNDRVDVILTRRDRNVDQAPGAEARLTETVLSDVRVLAIDQTVEEKNGQHVVVGKTATLELTPRQAETLALAHQMGTLALTLRGLADADPVQLETTEVLVARNEVGIGQALAAKDLQWQAWPAVSVAPAFIRKSDRPDAIEQVAGEIARAPLSNGEPVREDRLMKANGSGYMAAILPAGMRAISTEISPETGAGGFILPNDRVDVILSRKDQNADKAADKTSGAERVATQTVLTDVKVLAIDQTVEEKNGLRVVVGKTATLELSPQEAETLAFAHQEGTLQLALRSSADNGKPEERAQRVSSRINMVRFGVSTSALPK